MFDSEASLSPQQLLSVLAGLRSGLAGLSTESWAEAELIDMTTELESLKSAAAAAQAQAAAGLARRRVERDGHVRGLGAEIALARGESPHKGARLLGLATALVDEMPCTLAALRSGVINEWRATILVRDTAVLTKEDRSRVDTEMADKLEGMGDRKVSAMARSIGYRLDPGSVLRRVRGAEADRRVSIRPAPDTMTWLGALLPVAHGVACHAALTAAADEAQAAGDERSRGQVMADTLVARVTGAHPVDPADRPQVQLHLVMSDHALLGADGEAGHEAAHIPGYGPIPAFLARDLVREADKTWVRRLFTSPDTGALVAMDATKRLFDGNLRRFLVLRDDVCRTPWCDAPIRHVDHIERHTDGGVTSAANGQGLCVRCNLVKEHSGWASRRAPDRRHRVTITTPTGHDYTGPPPVPPPGARRRTRALVVEIYRALTPVECEYALGA
ncbi:MAG: DUF222 domain-containing protein [Nocardioides sp.]|nr:DUF222 domain-containing protein [Nocardioides sp.]